MNHSYKDNPSVQVLQFCPISEFEQGTIYDLLCESYAPLVDVFPQHADALRQQWQETDTFAFSMRDTPVAECFFITCYQNVPIGMGSFDPRELPVSARVGQNCLLPTYQGSGYGKLQIQHILDRLKKRGASKIIVVTGLHPFFLPAQRMYLSCGFCEARRFPGDFSECIQYELTLTI